MAGIGSILRSNDVVNMFLRDKSPFLSRARRTQKMYEGASSDGRVVLLDDLYDLVLRSARRTRYGKETIAPDRDWPAITKSQVIQDSLMFSNRFVPSVSASTGGTTGSPILLKRSLESIAAERFFISSLLGKFGLELATSKVLILRADEIKNVDDRNPPYGVYRNFGRDLVLSNAHLSATTLNWYCEEVKRFKPDVLMAYPSMLENLLLLLSEGDRSLDIPFVLTSSEMCNPRLFALVQDVLGGNLVDYYGQGERVAMALAYEPGVYRFLPTYGRVELHRNRPDTPSSDSGGLFEIVATGHWNLAMPLVRYQTGDIAMVAEGVTVADVESGIASFQGIQGRKSEYIVGPDGEVIGGLNHIPRFVQGLLRTQVIQESYSEIEIRVFSDGPLSIDAQNTLMNNARALVPKAIEITLNLEDGPIRLANGKMPMVVRNVDSRIAPADTDS